MNVIGLMKIEKNLLTMSSSFKPSFKRKDDSIVKRRKLMLQVFGFIQLLNDFPFEF